MYGVFILDIQPSIQPVDRIYRELQTPLQDVRWPLGKITLLRSGYVLSRQPRDGAIARRVVATDKGRTVTLF